MAVAGPAFVTPHARKRFQRRIARLPDNEALAAIIRGLERPRAIRVGRRQDGVPVIDVAVDGEYQFIATLVVHPDPRLRPAVVTILPATVGRNRPGRYKWERPRWQVLRWNRCA